MSYQQRYKKGEMERVCEDFKSFKGCGQKILMKQTNEPKEDGSGFKWKKFELDGVTPHVHNDSQRSGSGSGSFRQYQQPKQAATYNPQQVTASNEVKMQAEQIAQLSATVDRLSLEVDSLKLKVAELQNQRGLGSTKESNDLTEMGVSKETRQDAGKEFAQGWPEQ